MIVKPRYRPSKSLFKWLGIWGILVILIIIFDKDVDPWSWILPGCVVWAICFVFDYYWWHSDRRMEKLKKKFDDDCEKVVKGWNEK